MENIGKKKAESQVDDEKIKLNQLIEKWLNQNKIDLQKGEKIIKEYYRLQEFQEGQAQEQKPKMQMMGHKRVNLMDTVAEEDFD